MSAQDQGFQTGNAGASAEREYNRRIAVRKERIQNRYGTRLGKLVLAFTDEPQTTIAWHRGAQGEQALATALASLPDVRLLNDRAAPGTRGNIDHIAVAPAGLFVIDSKAHKGTVHVGNVGNFFRRDERLFVGRRDCSRYAVALGWQVEAVQHVVARLHLEVARPVVPVLCFVEADWPIFGAPSEYMGVRVESPRSLKKLLVQEHALGPTTVDVLAAALAAALPSR